MATDQLENEPCNRILFVRGVLKLCEGPGRSLIQSHTESDPEYSIIRTQLTLRDPSFRRGSTAD